MLSGHLLSHHSGGLPEVGWGPFKFPISYGHFQWLRGLCPSRTGARGLEQDIPHLTGVSSSPEATSGASFREAIPPGWEDVTRRTKPRVL